MRRRVASVPARVNILGEHTDYRGGLSLPFACQNRLVLTAVERGEGYTGEPAVIDLWISAGGWPADLSIQSDIPIGAGMSSSAALCVAVVLCAQGDNDRMEICNEAQRIEHEIIGTECGLLDQIAITHASQGHAVRIDFSNLEVQQFQIPQDWCFKLVDSGIRRQLRETDYGHSIVSEEDWQQHTIEENRRVIVALDCDASQLGELLNQSHESLRDKIKVSTPEMDDKVREIQEMDGVLGARMMGGGFGGMILALVESGSVLSEDTLIASNSAFLEEFF